MALFHVNYQCFVLLLTLCLYTGRKNQGIPHVHQHTENALILCQDMLFFPFLISISKKDQQEHTHHQQDHNDHHRDNRANGCGRTYGISRYVYPRYTHFMGYPVRAVHEHGQDHSILPIQELRERGYIKGNRLPMTAAYLLD